MKASDFLKNFSVKELLEMINNTNIQNRAFEEVENAINEKGYEIVYFSETCKWYLRKA